MHVTLGMEVMDLMKITTSYMCLYFSLRCNPTQMHPTKSASLWNRTQHCARLKFCAHGPLGQKDISEDLGKCLEYTLIVKVFKNP